ncbi:MAG: hypothetical protein OJF51_000591 [Nitrospira sp.]|nr:MAG: hypothetical protein OJF51_000591 [Nitrospira sp.]
MIDWESTVFIAPTHEIPWGGNCRLGVILLNRSKPNGGWRD